MKIFKILSFVLCVQFVQTENIFAYTQEDIEKARTLSAVLVAAGIPLCDDASAQQNHRIVRCPHIRQQIKENEITTSFDPKIPEILWSLSLLTNQVLSVALEKDKSLLVKLSQRFWQLYQARKNYPVDVITPDFVDDGIKIWVDRQGQENLTSEFDTKSLLADAGGIVLSEVFLFSMLRLIKKQFPQDDQVTTRRVLRVITHIVNSLLLAGITKGLDVSLNKYNPKYDYSLPALAGIYALHHSLIELVGAGIAYNMEKSEKVHELSDSEQENKVQEK